jgi:hypothetical protein
MKLMNTGNYKDLVIPAKPRKKLSIKIIFHQQAISLLHMFYNSKSSVTVELSWKMLEMLLSSTPKTTLQRHYVEISTKIITAMCFTQGKKISTRSYFMLISQSGNNSIIFFEQINSIYNNGNLLSYINCFCSNQ